MTLRLALVGGPMYDPLYEVLEGEDVEIVVHADHPTLNAEVARLLSAGERLDVISTHGKYAPSQRDWLQPLGDLVDVRALAPKAVELCSFEGDLLCAPRNIDVRILWVRADHCEPPDTWEELERVAAVGHAFGFPGRESGLFGTFFELVVAHGGVLFDDHGRPSMNTPIAEAAVALLVRLAGHAPGALPLWHYDDVDAALIDGRVAMAAAWPGGAGPIRASDHYDQLVPSLYPAGPARRVSYAGCHGWAIPQTASDPHVSADLITKLCSYETSAIDAAHGSVCAHVDAFAAVQPVDATDARRLEVTREMVADAMITYPPLVRFPEIEDAGWSAIRSALVGDLTPSEAVASVQAAAESVLSES